MTTPAIHTSQIFGPGSFHVRVFHKDTHTEENWNATGFQYGLAKEDREASVSVPITNGWRPCAPWYHWGGSLVVSGGRMHYSDSLNDVTATGDIYRLANSLPQYGGSVSSNMRNKCLNKALDKVKNQKVQLSVFMAELGRSVRMVDSNLASIAGTVVSFRRRFPKLWEQVRQWQRGGLPRHLWCNIPDKWLEIQYGWKPLMSDIVAIINVTSKKEVPKIDAHATVVDESIFEVPFERAPGAVVPVVVAPRQRFLRRDRCTTWLYYGMSNYSARNADQLGLANPGELVWETLPYSFIVDWALPIGEWIGNLTADRGLSFVGGGQNAKVEVRLREGIAGMTVNSEELAPPNVTGEINNFDRRCYPSSPVPGLYVKNPLSLMHLANGLSLLATSMRR